MHPFRVSVCAWWIALGSLLSPAAGRGAELVLATRVEAPAAAHEFGVPGSTGFYRLASEAAVPGSVVRSFRISLGFPESDRDGDGDTARQWIEWAATKADGRRLRAWLWTERYPPESLTEAQRVIARYLLQEGDAEPLEFRDRSTGRAVLPITGVWPHLFPQPVADAGWDRGFPRTTRLLGHRYALERVETNLPPSAPACPRVLNLHSEVLIGVPHNTKQADDTRRYDGSDYTLVPLTAADYDAMIDAGMNCFHVDATQQSWLEGRPVFTWGGSVADLPYPEALYRSTYLGPALFLDEPAVGTRDHVLRPRLRQEPRFRDEITPLAALTAFHAYFHHAKHEGGPAILGRGLATRPDVALGTMRFLQANLFSWETMIATAAHQLSEDAAPPPFALVFEPPGRMGTWRTLPELNMTYGCQIPIDNPAHLTGLLYGFLRGAARLTDRDWGTSIYGPVDPADAPWWLTHAYDLGARVFFFWDTYQRACVPFRECLALSRHLQAHIDSRPPRDLAALKRAAETLFLLPPGYNLGHTHLGRGSLWGLPELNLERTNRFGVTYRTVMHHLFIEIERCIRHGTAYDVAWDLPGLDLAGYRETVRVREDGQLEVRDATGVHLRTTPRTPERPGGAPPGLTVHVSPPRPRAATRVTLEADVVETAAPVFYTTGANARGVSENAVVLWELFGPGAADYRALLGEGSRPQIVRTGSGYRVRTEFQPESRGAYRLRTATVDRAGRSTVVWTPLEVAD